MASPVEWLKADFDQCFNQMRHYDAIYAMVARFAFAFYAAIVAFTVVFLYQSKIPDLAYFGLSILYGLTALVGVLALAFLLRNRCYFSFAARFISAVRESYRSQMDPDLWEASGLPPRAKPASTQAVHMYVVALLNTAFLAAAVLTYRYYASLSYQTSFVLYLGLFIGLVLAFFLVQVGWIIFYLPLKARPRVRKKM